MTHGHGHGHGHIQNITNNLYTYSLNRMSNGVHCHCENSTLIKFYFQNNEPFQISFQ